MVLTLPGDLYRASRQKLRSSRSALCRGTEATLARPPRPPSPPNDPAREIGEYVEWVARVRESSARKQRQRDLEHNGEDDPVLKDFPRPGISVVRAQANPALDVQDHRQKKRQAQHIVETAVREPPTDVMGLENEAVERVERQARRAQRVGEVMEPVRRAPHRQCPLARAIWKNATQNAARTPTSVVSTTCRTIIARLGNGRSRYDRGLTGSNFRPHCAQRAGSAEGSRGL